MAFYALLRSCYRFLDFHVLCRMPAETQRVLKGRLLAWGRRFYPERVVETNSRHLVRDVSNVKPWRPPALPDWVRAEMGETAAEIDPALDPEGEYGKQMEYFGVPTTYDWPGLVYADLRKRVASRPDVVILVPWLKRGGADLGAIHFATALHEDLGRSVLVVATEAADSPWASRLPGGVQFLEAGARLAELADDERMYVMARLLLQLDPAVVHVMNSKLGWDVVRKHGLAIRQERRIFASLYCDDIAPNGLPVGYAQSYLADCYVHLTGVMTDNGRNYQGWCAQMGVPAELFHVVGFPAPRVAIDPPAPTVARNRLLWAGRFDRQKRPDLIAPLARALPEFEFDVHGAPVLADHGVDLSELRRLGNVHLHGAFERFVDVVKPRHLALVYTAAWDGLPNVLLEAAAAGLPVVAPDLGGIPEFLPAEQLIASVDDVEGYANWVRSIAANPEAWWDMRARGLERIASQRRWPDFLAAVRRVPGYLGDATLSGRSTPRPA